MNTVLRNPTRSLPLFAMAAIGCSSGDISPTNLAPIAVDDVVVARQDQPLTIDASTLLSNDGDDEGDPLLVVAADPTSGAGAGVVVGSDGSIAYTPSPGFWGSDSFEYTISDGVTEASARVTVHVVPVYIPLDQTASRQQGLVLDGAETVDGAGWAVSDAGDVNGDGLADVLVGAPYGSTNATYAGRSYVVFGRTDSVALDLSSISEGIGGFAIEGEGAFDASGSAVSGAGDVNGDGLADVIVGSWSAPNSEERGRSYVVFGKSDTATVELSAITAGVGGFAVFGHYPGDTAGEAVSDAGDVNGDGLADVLIGASNADQNGVDAGRSYVVFGKLDGDPVELSAVASGTGGFLIDGAQGNELSGASVSSLGDLDADGYADVLVGAPGSNPNGPYSGRAYVVFGKPDTAAVDLGQVRLGEGGFAIEGEAESSFLGVSVSGAGDVNGDGLPDLITGAWGASPNGDDSGRAYVVFGKLDTDPVDLTNLANNGAGGFAIDGEAADNFIGSAIGGAGDVNGDGLADLILAASSDSKLAYVVFGKADSARVDLGTIRSGVGGFVLEGAAPLEVSGAGDVNGDGLADLLLGDPAADVGGEDSGRAYVVWGVPTFVP